MNVEWKFSYCDELFCNCFTVSLKYWLLWCSFLVRIHGSLTFMEHLWIVTAIFSWTTAWDPSYYVCMVLVLVFFLKNIITCSNRKETCAAPLFYLLFLAYLPCSILGDNNNIVTITWFTALFFLSFFYFCLKKM